MIRSSNTAAAPGGALNYIHEGDENIEEENTDNEYYSDTISGDEEQHHLNYVNGQPTKEYPKKSDTNTNGGTSSFTKSKFFARNVQKKLYKQLNSIKGSRVGVGARKSNK